MSATASLPERLRVCTRILSALSLSPLWAGELPLRSGREAWPRFLLNPQRGRPYAQHLCPPEDARRIGSGVSPYRRYRELGRQIGEDNARRRGVGKERARPHRKLT